MVLWASMLSSHFSPQKLSTVTLRTVPVSRQCGATPIQTATTKKDGLMRNVNSYIMSCHWICGGWGGGMTIIIYSNSMAQWESVDCLALKTAHVCLKNARDTCHVLGVSRHTVSVRVGAWSVETLNPTGFTEGVFRSVSVERVCCQIIWPLERKWKTGFLNMSINIFLFKWPLLP